jgi:hypothetical protein
MAHIGPLSASLHNILLPDQFDSIMPHVLQPGGLLRNMRVRYTARRKLGLLASANHIMEEEGVTLRRAAKRLHVPHSLFVRWQQQRAANVDPILAMLKSKRKLAHARPLGQLKPLEQVLLRYIFEHCKQGMTVHTFDLVVKASSLSPKFNAKHFVARCSAAKRFMRTHLLVYRMGTHQAQAQRGRGRGIGLHEPCMPTPLGPTSQPAFHPQHGSNAGLLLHDAEENT